MSVTVGRWAEPAPRRRTGQVTTALAVAAAAIALVWQGLGAPFMPFGIVGVLTLGASLFFFPAVGVVLFLAVAWTNAPVVVARAGGNPWILGALTAGMLLVPAFMQAFALRRGVIVDRPFLLMLAFLGALLLSTFVARDYDLALAWVGTYVAEGLLLYFLVINAIRDVALLRRALGTLVAVCALLSTFAIYQEVTREYEQDFAGFAGRKFRGEEIKPGTKDSTGLIRSREKVSGQDRACGPVDDPNHFAQILLVACPIGLMLSWSEPRRLVRAAMLILTALVLSGVLLTYSRGGFLTLVLLLVLLVALGYLRVRHVLIAAAALTGIVITVAPGYLERMDSIRSASDLDTASDAAVTGRATEMLAALNVLLDHPIVGVGPGQYTPFYSLEYMDDPGVAYRQIGKERRAHTLYFELGAETGVLGLAIFLGIAALVLARLQRVRVRFAGRPEVAHAATGIGLAMLTYLGTSVFLSLAFMRYWWLVLALAGVAVRVAGKGDGEDREAFERAALREAAG